MSKFSLRQFVFQQHCIPWKLRLLVRRLVPWTARRWLFHGRTNLNSPERMDGVYARLDDDFSSMENLYERILDLLPARGRVGDMGCGIGVLLRRIRRGRPELQLCGVDFSPVAVERTRRYGFQAELAALPGVPYPDRHFDCLICTEVLEHLDDPAGALRSFHRVLRPGGTLIVSVPRGMGPDHCDQHMQDFTEESLRRSLSEAGFDVRSIQAVVREPYRTPAESFLAVSTRADYPGK